MALAANGKTTYSIAQAAAQLTREGLSWSSVAGVGTTLTYSFRATAPGTMPDDATGFQPFNQTQIRGAELALQAWSDVANVRFSRVGEGGYSDDGVLRMANYTDGVDGAAAFSYLPSRFPSRSASSLQGDSWFNLSLPYNENPSMFGYGQRVLVHELGHALGLEHPGEYNASANETITYAADAEYYEDSRQYSIMSYFSEANTGAAFRGYYASSPLLHDIAAIQNLYGANTAAFAGDTVYGFGSNTARPWFTAADARSPLIFSVWDAGGTDTFDFSGYTQAQRINLNGGEFSNVGGLTGNVSIARGAQVENAIAGSGADVLVGNAAANFMLGMDGADSIDGGGGADDVNGNMGADTVQGGEGADWVRGGRDNDVVIGGGGDDPHVNGNLGNDTAYGGDGNDTVYGGQGDDMIFGDAGADWLSGDLGADLLTGGLGADRFLFRQGWGADWIADFSAAQGDRVLLAQGTVFALSSFQNQAVVDLGNGDRLAFAGVSPDALGDWLVYV